MNSLDTYEFAIIFLLGEKDFGKCAFTDFVQDIEVGKIDIDLAMRYFSSGKITYS